ncbi:hypothetical protein [Brasilonema sp. UFV-L1]|uniref:DUF6972 family protein n=1 Tax=Brasilonema sp. UFV-L1 TaxID=2234130 RepID=UPI00145F33A7|nr:hypothetical protein [Brasilonema sp. UFV-L1]NMG10657.1 hypothetical protein [Brasilonema sp. UFV-L1]
MSLIDRELTLDIKHVAKHLPDTPQMQQLLQKEGSAHVFNDEATMSMVTQAIIEKGEFTGVIRGHERYGLYFNEPVGYRVSIDGSKIPLYYAQMKVKGNKYHVIPRTKPS